MDFAVTRLQTTCGPGRRYPLNPFVFGEPTRLFDSNVADQVFNDPEDDALRGEYRIVTQFAQVDDVGVVLVVQMVKQSDGSPMDISAASELNIIIGYPGGVREIKDAFLLTNGIDGKLYYVTVANDLPIPGDHFVQGKVVFSNGDTFYSAVQPFEVKVNIEPGNEPPTPDPHVGTFIDSDLVDGMLTITHNEGLSSPFTIDITIFDNNGHEIVPDSITGHSNTVDINLSSYVPLLGTWGYVYI